ncbi:hypothetical protein TRFO_38701 [Tritrichomonas foetus]|uniref:Polycystin cation channel PKD1/PKD2 domain-containing protein n=1 Tax=Tritrichomonas foetus TaxID=1144522 RepID=A0A1J4J783_9EUKA|nr:hypothetical protein TRFO_38701 [Tritrichomonas foetus]|eukprot:OHS95086.1 hypothetical protein TRFO_38701 [Tritrichomonas foetus]
MKYDDQIYYLKVFMSIFDRYANRDVSASALNLGGREIHDNSKFLIRKHSRHTKLRPHHPYRNWVIGYQIPWICFIEISMMILYFILGYLHQHSTIDFSIDFSKAVNDYFLSGFDFPTDDDGKIDDPVPIYFKSDFFNIANETGYRLLSFIHDFPCSNLILSDDEIHLNVKSKKSFQNKISLHSWNNNVNSENNQKEFVFDRDNISQLIEVVEYFSDFFEEMSLFSNFPMQKIISDVDEKLDITLYSVFSFNSKTRIISFRSHHTKILRSTVNELSFIFSNPLFTIPMILSILAIISIILTINYIKSVYKYSKEKAITNFQEPKKIFYQKFSGWSIYSLICHFFTIISCITYSLNMTDYSSSVPITMILMSISTFLHCILLLRYLKQKSSTMIIVNVTAKAIIKIGQFLVGCLTIFLAYLILGCSFFGTYDETFKSLISGAECLLAVIHGDAIQDMFDSAELRSDINVWFGIIYWGLWIFFSLTIMFNISISIFEEVLTDEIYLATSNAQKKDHEHEINQFNYILPLSYRRVF